MDHFYNLFFSCQLFLQQLFPYLLPKSSCFPSQGRYSRKKFPVFPSHATTFLHAPRPLGHLPVSHRPLSRHACRDGRGRSLRGRGSLPDRGPLPPGGCPAYASFYLLGPFLRLFVHDVLPSRGAEHRPALLDRTVCLPGLELSGLWISAPPPWWQWGYQLDDLRRRLPGYGLWTTFAFGT